MYTEEMQKLVLALNYADRDYYQKDNPTLTDKEYDKMYNQLQELEQKTGIVLSGSPTHKVSGVISTEFRPVQHTIPMLSANKTKDINEIMRFCRQSYESGQLNKSIILSWKEDGLTIVVRYKDGKFVQGITRGDGYMGEDVTEQVGQIINLPMTIPYKDPLEIRGECVLPWAVYKKMKESDETLGHPRNVAGGAIRQLDASVTKSKKLIFKPFAVISDTSFRTVAEQYNWLRTLGFDPVEYTTFANTSDINVYQKLLKDMDPVMYPYPVDGLIFAFNDIAYGQSLGSTEHHPLNMMALKWEDKTYETKLTGVDFTVTKTGVISMTAKFNPKVIDNTVVSRALIPNLRYWDKLKLGIGDNLRVYKANKIIPQIDSNDIQSGTLQLPTICPCCGKPLARTNLNLICSNPDCSAKKIRLFKAFCSKKGFNILGLSEQTLSKFINSGIIRTFSDICALETKKDLIIHLLGEKTAEHILSSVQTARTAHFANVVASVSIPGVGLHVGKILEREYKNAADFYLAVKQNKDFSHIEGIGQEANKSIHNWFNNESNAADWEKVLSCTNVLFSSIEVGLNTNSSILAGKIIVVTGTLHNYTRTGIQSKIESLGAKAGSSVSKKTDYVLVGENPGSKYEKAKALGIKILNEEEFENIATGGTNR